MSSNTEVYQLLKTTGFFKKVKSEGADLIVVQSEIGLVQNLKIVQSFKDIDVMYSAHTHEITLVALLADTDGVIRTILL